MAAEPKGTAIHSIERDGPADITGLEDSTINQFEESQIGIQLGIYDILAEVNGNDNVDLEAIS